jgi:hypothetical protein
MPIVVYLALSFSIPYFLLRLHFKFYLMVINLISTFNLRTKPVCTIPYDFMQNHFEQYIFISLNTIGLNKASVSID